jgi:hypothetical protein
MPSDDDILSQLEEIDAEQITGTEVPLDEDLDLDFEDEGVPISKPKAAEPEMRIGDGRANQAAVAQGLLPAGGAKPKVTEQTGLTGSEIRIGGPAMPAGPKATDSGSKAKKTQKAPPLKAAAIVPPAPQTAKPKDVAAAIKEQDEQNYEDPRKPGVAVSNVQEMVLHAKTLRIIADTVVIEPKTVSISSS